MDEDADDYIEEGPAGFAAFAGPDRAEAVAHWNIKSLVEAADELDRTPVPPPAPKIIANEDAGALFALAEISVEAARGVAISKEPQAEDMAMPGVEAQTPSAQTPSVQLSRRASPIDDWQQQNTETSTHIKNAARSNDKPTQIPAMLLKYPDPKATPAGINGTQPSVEQPPPKNDAPVRSTHRVMDMLNNDSDMPPAKPKPSPSSMPAQPLVEQLPSINRSVPPPVRNGMPGFAAIMNHDTPPERSTLPTSAEVLPSREVYPSPVPDRAWPRPPSPRMHSHIQPMSLEELRRKDPLHMLREMLGARDGNSPLNQRPDDGQRRERSHMTAPPYPSRPYSPTNVDRAEESRRTSGAYNASPSQAPLSYQQSPIAAPAYLPRQNSQEAAASHWEHGRRLSGSQPTQAGTSQTPQFIHQQHAGSPPQHNSSLSHQSPFSAPKTTQLPSISQSIPSKPAINFRFAHYDPAPPRASHPPQQSSYTPPSHQHPSTHAPPPPPPPPPPPAAPQYNYGYNGPYGSNYHSSQPPPPPPPPPTASTPYPPLKIHQYGGQPILPANMAPPPPTHQRQSPYAEQNGDPNIDPQLMAYSPPQQHQVPQQQQGTTYPPPSASAPSAASTSNSTQQAQDRSGDRSGDSNGPQPRPRRAYRAYHAPGSQFRPYNGPDAKKKGLQ